MMQNYKYERNTTNKFSIKGLLSQDGETITYIDGDKNEREIALIDCFKPFRGESFDLSISTKTVEDLSEEFEDEE